MDIFNLYYGIIFAHSIYGFLIYGYLLKNLPLIEKITKITIQVNILNLIYYFYRILLLNNFIYTDNSSFLFSLLFNYNLIVFIGYIIYRLYIEKLHNFYIYYDSVQLHFFNLIYMIAELGQIEYNQLYFESNIILSIIIFNAWIPLYYFCNKWNYNVCIFNILGIGYICIMYILNNFTTYMINTIKN